MFLGTDGVLLSEETATGLYPVEAIKIANRICIEAERCLNYNGIFNFIYDKVMKGNKIISKRISENIKYNDRKCNYDVAISGKNFGYRVSGTDIRYCVQFAILDFFFIS